jgi:murein DD-endopeptidase MepM/ murein hydrolase activator NlpD
VATLVVALVAALVAPVAAATPPARPAHEAPEERRLQTTRAKIAAVRAEIEQAKTRAARGADSLAVADRQLATVLEAVGEAQAAVDRQHAAVHEARAQLDALAQREADQRRVLAARAVSLYKHGSGGAPFSAILAADTPAEAVDRSAFVTVVTRADRASFEGVTAAQTATDAQRRELEAHEAALERVLDQQRAVLADAEALRKERAIALAAARSNVADLQAQERHLEGESREIAALARRASRGVGASRSLASASAAVADAAPQPARGGWVWPTRGPVTSGFGRRWGRMHEGIDIGAPTGRPIVAARSGVVTYAGRMSGYGNIVLIDHGGGIVTAYAHQSRILSGVGQRVGAGERIGLVGSTGRSTGPHLHFEVRVNGSPRNPRAYLG